MNFQKINNLTGWAMFAVATLVYMLTIEETASYWDCGEFIAVSYKLQVPHPPGAPLFLLLGRMFSFLAFGNVEQVAFWVNVLSVLASGFTILFLFWTITLFGRKIMGITDDSKITSDQTVLLMGAGAVGALTCTFSDSFWFSAVEAEVYAMSSFFTAFVVWAMLKWDVIEDESKANRWLILLAYLIGLSIGVHLLNLVTLPALGLIYYFKKYKPGTWGIVATLLLSGGLILLINDIIIPGLPSLAGGFEVFFVNSLGLPFDSGALVFVLLLTGVLVYGIYYSQKKSRPVLNTFLLSVTFILIGYSSYTLVLIRSNFNPPIDENNPQDVMEFVKYLKREQYGSRPLLFGQYFTAQPIGYEKGPAVYSRGEEKYEITDYKTDYKYDAADMHFLPRVWSTDPDHQRRYREILNLGDTEKPTGADNLRYLFSHQIGWMYVRYFFWNFAGRESDIQDADWIGPSQWGEKLPDSLAQNKGRNNYYLIPLLLGLIGMYFHVVRDSKNFAVVGLLFILTGAALVVYLNSPPSEPRERDYIYSGSFYTFAIWIGFSVLAIAEVFGKAIRNLRVSSAIAILIGLAAPALMAFEGWDDHDRSHRYFSVDSAKNYLASCAPNAILFSGGDNDTFPLWYAQEVEGFRTDMRVIVLSYYNTDWYIDQTMRQTYESQPFPYTLTHQNYKQGGLNDVLPFEDLKIGSIEAREFLGLIKREHKGLQLYPTSNIIPSRTITLKVDKERVRKLGIVPPQLDSLLVDEMVLRLKGRYLEKKDLAMLDVLTTADWERPIYVNNTSLSQFNLDLSAYAVQEGNTYRILPVKNPDPARDLVNSDVAFENMTKRFSFRGLDDDRVYNSVDYRNFVLNHRSSFNSLAETLIAERKPEKAREALLFSLERMPDRTLPYDYTSVKTVELLLEVGEKEKALEMARIMTGRADANAEYYISKATILNLDVQREVIILRELQYALFKYGETELASQTEEAYKRHIESIQYLN
jgi:hypothetical protein